MVDELVFERLFVYGSFCEGFVHHEKLKNSVIQSEKATITGITYMDRVGFPVVCEGNEDKIPGELLTLRQNCEMTLWMNRFFKAESDVGSSKFVKVATRVTTAKSESHLAFAYFLNPNQLNKFFKRASGLSWLEELQVNPPIPTRLSEGQKTYLSRLSKVSGREIVPIDLKLYRELINLEMIVDKGRRLALSKLGHEVVRFLE